MNIQIRNKHTFDIIFEYDCEDNTMRKTVLAAIKAKVSLVNANLRGANLSSISFNNLNLTGVNFSNANLEGSSFEKACIQSAYFGYANLKNINFRNANLRGSEFTEVDIVYADFTEANLEHANFIDSNIRASSFILANLKGAKFNDTSLRFINFRYAQHIPFIPSHLPVGEFIGWKKCQNKIIKLKILEDSKRSRGLSDKCRCDKALVLGFEKLDGTPITDITEIVNTNYIVCHYKVGEIVYADQWDDNRWNECSHGIHFFIDRQSAIEY